jgi:hypothetical protein
MGRDLSTTSNVVVSSTSKLAWRWRWQQGRCWEKTRERERESMMREKWEEK